MLRLINIDLYLETYFRNFIWLSPGVVEHIVTRVFESIITIFYKCVLSHTIKLLLLVYSFYEYSDSFCSFQCRFHKWYSSHAIHWRSRQTGDTKRKQQENLAKTSQIFL